MRRPVFVIAIVAIVLLLAVLALRFLVDASQFRPAIQSELSKSLGRDVKIGELKLGIFSGTVTASDLSVADDPSFSQTAFLSAKSLTLSIDLLPALFSHKLNVTGITINTPEASLIQSPSGQWNFSKLGKTQAAGPSHENLALSVKSLKINNARLSISQRGGKPQILDDVSMEVRDFAPASAWPFSLSAKIAGGGDIALEGKAGPIDSTDAADTPVTANVKVTSLNLAASGAVPASAGIDGVVSMDGNITSNGHNLDLTGKGKTEKLKLTPRATAAKSPLLFDVAVEEDLNQHSGQVSRGDLAIGSVKTSLTGTFLLQGESLVLKMILSAAAVPVSGLEELMPALDIVLPAGSTLEGGTATATLTLSGPANALVMSGPVTVRNTRLKGFDLGAKMSPIEKLAGLKSGPSTEIQAISADLRTGPEGTSLRNIHLVLPSLGDVGGSGTISPAHVLDFKMQATVHPGILTSILVPSNIPFSIVGTSSDPQFRADVGHLATEEISRGLKGVKVGGTDAGKTADTVLQGLFGGKKQK